ncbi:hypothetical protein J9303_13880 [Bacillaceae bacterium Marseille-Q3522]|nr:hypothetical protein [Bacillaceae bacterium Marseille-Q3522]
MKWNRIFFVLLTLLIFIPTTALAGISRDVYPVQQSDFYQKKYSSQLYIKPTVTKVVFTQYSSGTPTEETKIGVIEWNVKPNSYIWIDQTCKGYLSFQYYNDAGERVEMHSRGLTNEYLNKGTCNASDFVKPSDWNDEEGRYAGDTYGGTQPKLTNPDPDNPDGSGGTGETGYIPPGSGDGGDGGDGSGDDGGGGSGGSCDNCSVFECPSWDEYMGGLEDIKNAIPPPPNWDEVAGKFRDTIVPGLINDLGDLLGSSPAPPTAPPQPGGVDDRGINDNRPDMPDVPGLGDAGFSSGDIKNDAPIISERGDPTGGFNLGTSPLDSIPEAPENPVPGDDAGEWGQNKPDDGENNFPEPPADSGDVDIGNPPTPGENEDTPPNPGDDSGSAPVPGDDAGVPPTTGDDGEAWMRDYKPSPDDRDGSGEVIPIDGDTGG